MSTTRLTIKEVEKRAKGSNEFVTLQNYEGKDLPEITIEVNQGPDKYYHYFLINSKTGRKRITRNEASELLKKYDVYSS